MAILYAHHLQLCDTYALREISALQNVLNMQYANCRQSQEAIELVNRKYHDLKHQIAVLRSDIGSNEKLEYLDQMEREMVATLLFVSVRVNGIAAIVASFFDTVKE